MERNKSTLTDDIEGLADIVQKGEDRTQGIRPFAGQFPKTCQCCNTVFDSLQSYIDQTDAINYRLYQVSPGKSFDFRNCKCGSSLVVSYRMERDSSELGDTQRALFNVCLKKMNAADDEMVEGLRVVFRYVLLMGPGYLATEECKGLLRKILGDENNSSARTNTVADN